MIRRPPRSTLFPYTTLFRSREDGTRVSGSIVPTATPMRESRSALGELERTPRFGLAVFLALDHARITRQEADRKSTRLNSSHTVISYAVFCLKKKKKKKRMIDNEQHKLYIYEHSDITSRLMLK